MKFKKRRRVFFTFAPVRMEATGGGCSFTARSSASSTLEGVTAAGDVPRDAACRQFLSIILSAVLNVNML